MQRRHLARRTLVQQRRDGLDVPARRVIMAEMTPQRLAGGVPVAVTG